MRHDSGNHSSHRAIHRRTDLLLSGRFSLDLGDDEMTYVLTVCLVFNSWLNACGRYIQADFVTEAQCRSALQDFKGQPAFSYGYCGVKEQK